MAQLDAGFNVFDTPHGKAFEYSMFDAGSIKVEFSLVMLDSTAVISNAYINGEKAVSNYYSDIEVFRCEPGKTYRELNRILLVTFGVSLSEVQYSSYKRENIPLPKKAKMYFEFILGDMSKFKIHIADADIGYNPGDFEINKIGPSTFKLQSPVFEAYLSPSVDRLVRAQEHILDGFNRLGIKAPPNPLINSELMRLICE